jgi:hypothetical protein
VREDSEVVMKFTQVSSINHRITINHH